MNCYLVGSGNRVLNNPLNWSSTSGGTPADVLGPELITNAADREFSSDTGFWIKGTGVTIANGLCHFNNIPSYGSSLKSGIVVNPGSWVKIDFAVLNYISGSVLIWDQMSGASNMITSNGIYSVYFKTSTGNIVFSSRMANATFDLDNVSIKEVLSVPNSSNPAIIDANSSIANGDILSISAQFDCGGFDCSAAAYTFTLSNAAYAFNVYGDLKDSTKRISGFSSTGYLYFKGSSNIYSNGATQDWNRIYFDGIGATFTNQDDWSVSGGSVYHINGEWKTQNYNISIAGIYFIDAGVKALTLGSNTFKVLQFRATNYANFTFNAGTSLVYNTGAVFDSLGKTFYNVRLEYSGLVSVSGAGTYNNLTINGQSNILSGATFDGNQTIQNTLTLTGNNAQNYRLLVTSNAIGTPRTITCNGSIVASNVDFRDITLAGTANRDLSAISGGSGDCGGNTGIVFTTAATMYYKDANGIDRVTNGNFESGICGFLENNAGGAVVSYTLNTTNPISGVRDGRLIVSSIGISASRPYINPNITGVVGKTYQFAFNYKVNSGTPIYQGVFTGSAFQGGGAVLTGSGTISAQIVCSANNAFCGFGFDGRNLYDIQVDNISIRELSTYETSEPLNWFSDLTPRTTSGRYPLPQDSAVFDANSFTGASTLSVNCPRIGRSLNMEAVNQAVTFALANAVTSYGGQRFSNNITLSGNFLWTFDGHGKTFDKVYIGVPSTFVNNLVLIGNNAFNELIIEKGRKVQITGGSTQTITGKLIADGTPTEQITIGSTNTTPFNLVYAGTGYHQVNYCNITYCNATANRFYAGSNSTDGGNNTGWLFRNYLKKQVRIIKRLIKL